MAAAAASSRHIKPCVSAPGCSVHKCRHKPTPCPDPEKCFKKYKKTQEKCQSAMEIITPRGLSCTCTRTNSGYNRSRKRGEKRRSNKPYKKRVAKMYKKRSNINKFFPKKNKCCEIL